MFAEAQIDIKETLIKVQEVLKDMDSICEESALEQSDNASELLMESQILKKSCEMMGNALAISPDVEFNDDEYYNAIVRLLIPLVKLCSNERNFFLDEYHWRGS